MLNSKFTTGQNNRPYVVPEKRIYNVSLRRNSSARMVLQLSLAFGTITAWVGLTKVWFGGSWVTDLFAIFVSISMLLALAKRSGSYAAMTKAEMQRWLDAGCPDTWPGKDDQQGA